VWYRSIQDRAAQVLHRFVAPFRRSTTNCVRAVVTGIPRKGWAYGTSWVGNTVSRNQAVTARSRAISNRKPSRVTSLFMACSPLATLARTTSPNSVGNVSRLATPHPATSAPGQRAFLAPAFRQQADLHYDGRQIASPARRLQCQTRQSHHPAGGLLACWVPWKEWRQAPQGRLLLRGMS